MKYTLTAPCVNCPFRTDVPNYLTRSRRREIATSITVQQQTFSCHKTNVPDEDNMRETMDSQHCAGALILLESINQPNQMMRIAERLGMYDRHKLKMQSPVFKNLKSFINHK